MMPGGRMFVLLLLISYAATTLVAPFSVQSLAHHGYSRNKKEAQKWICHERKNYAGFVLLHSKRPLTGFDDSLSPLNEQDDGNISYLGSRFGLKDDWYTNNTRYTQIDNMDRSAMTFRLKWIKKRLKLNEAQLGKLIGRCPMLLTLRSEMNVEPTIQFLQKELALNNTRLSTLIVKQPTIISLGTNKNQTLQRNLNWFKSRLHLKDPKKLGKFVVAAPQILALDVENNLEPTFLSLKERLGLNETQASKIVVKCPTLLSLSFTKSIDPKLAWLENMLHLNQKQLGKVIQQRPSLLALSMDKGMKPKLAWLRERLCLDEREVANLVRRAPFLLDASEDKLVSILQWLKQQLCLDQGDSVRAFVCKAPTVLGLSVESNVGPTLDFYKEHLGSAEARQFVVKNPIVLASSLKNRLEPRLKQAKEMGILVDVACMRQLWWCSDTKWLLWLQKKLRTQ